MKYILTLMITLASLNASGATNEKWKCTSKGQANVTLDFKLDDDADPRRTHIRVGDLPLMKANSSIDGLSRRWDWNFINGRSDSMFDISNGIGIYYSARPNNDDALFPSNHTYECEQVK